MAAANAGEGGAAPPEVTAALLTYEELCATFHLPIRDAASSFGICLTLLKVQCRRLGVGRWPQRQIEAILKFSPELLKQREDAKVDPATLSAFYSELLENSAKLPKQSKAAARRQKNCRPEQLLPLVTQDLAQKRASAKRAAVADERDGGGGGGLSEEDLEGAGGLAACGGGGSRSWANPSHVRRRRRLGSDDTTSSSSSSSSGGGGINKIDSISSNISTGSIVVVVGGGGGGGSGSSSGSSSGGGGGSSSSSSGSDDSQLTDSLPTAVRFLGPAGHSAPDWSPINITGLTLRSLAPGGEERISLSPMPTMPSRFDAAADFVQRCVSADPLLFGEFAMHPRPRPFPSSLSGNRAAPTAQRPALPPPPAPLLHPQQLPAPAIAAGETPLQLRPTPLARPGEADDGLGLDQLPLLPPLPYFAFGEGASAYCFEALAEEAPMPGVKVEVKVEANGGAADAALAAAEEAAAAAEAAAGCGGTSADPAPLHKSMRIFI